MGQNGNPIIDGFKRQNSKALEALYDDCGQTLYGLIFRIVGDGVASEAILELTFREIWTRSYRQVQNDPDLRTLAFRLGRKKALEYQQGEASVEADDQDVLGNSDAVRAAITQLSPEDRALLNSIYTEHRTLSEIALLSDLPRVDVQRRVETVFKILRGARETPTPEQVDEPNQSPVPRPQSTDLEDQPRDYPFSVGMPDFNSAAVSGNNLNRLNGRDEEISK